MLHEADTRLPVAEIFYSIQCEGYHAGTAAVFVRLAGCNLRCPWCDTDHKANEHLTAIAIAEQVASLFPGNSLSLVVLTGGEPTIHDLSYLIGELQDRNMYIALETNGTRPLPRGLHWITFSPKPECQYDLSSMQCNEVKVVLDGVIDPEPFLQVAAGQHFIQPCSEDFGPAVQYVKEHPQWRLSVQLQKLLKIQ